MPARQLTPDQVTDLGEAAGKIAAFAAKALHREYPHLDLEGLVGAFTQDSALEMIALRFLDGIEHGKSPGDAAGDAGKALIRAWADARLAARVQLDQEQKAPDRPDDCTWDGRVICRCGTEVHDNEEARRGHHEQWHTTDHPAVYTARLVVHARDIRHGDVIRGYYQPGVTVTTALVPDGQFQADQEHAVGLFVRPHPARAAGLAALDGLRTSRRFAEDAPIFVTREHSTPAGS